MSEAHDSGAELSDSSSESDADLRGGGTSSGVARTAGEDFAAAGFAAASLVTEGFAAVGLGSAGLGSAGRTTDDAPPRRKTALHLGQRIAAPSASGLALRAFV